MPATIIRFGNEQRVNTETALDQSQPSVTGLDDGGWLVTWTSEGQDGSNYGIYQQRYNADGTPRGGERPVNVEPRNFQYEPSVAALTGGGWVVTWNSHMQDGDFGGIYQRFYDRDGNPDPKGEMKVNTHFANHQYEPSVTALNDGGWLVTWTSVDQDRSYEGIYRQRYDANGNADPEGEQLVNTTHTANTQYRPSAAGLKNGGWVIAWASIGQDDPANRNGEGIFLSHRDANGNVRITQVNTTIEGDQSWPSVTALADGGWVVTWTCIVDPLNSYGKGIFQQYYNASGEAVGGEQQVNINTDGFQQDPSVTALAEPDGGWIVTWTATDQDGDEKGIFQQRYDSKGNAVGGQQQVNIHETHDQLQPSVTGLKDGSWLVTWVSDDQDGSSYGVYQRQYMSVAEFGAGKEYGTGTDDNDTFQVRAGGLTAGDSLDGGDGNDTLQMIEAGTLDLTAPDVFTSVETIQGSGGNDIIVVDENRLSDITAFHGGEGRDALHVRAGSHDLSGVMFSGFESITLTSTGSLTFDDKATALLARSITREGTVILNGGSFSDAELGTLFTRGLIEITDDNGTHAYMAPTVQATTTSVRILMTQTTSPFQDPVITGNPGMTFTATVTMSAADQGRFVSTSGGKYDPATGVYTVAGTAADVETALKNLVFDPRDRGAVINSTESTSLTLVVSDGVQSTSALVKVVESTATNVAPGEPLLSHTFILENAKAGEVVGDVMAIDPNPGDPLTIDLTDNAGGRFVLGTDGKLRVASGAVFDYEAAASHQIKIKVADAGKLVTEKTFTVYVGDIPVEIIKGTTRADKLTGGTGKDVLYGGAGKDTLTGDKGADIFVFNTKPNTKTNKDKIVDFNVKEDGIWLENKVFTKLGKSGSEKKPVQLKKDFFTLGTKAKDKNDYVIYDSKKGVLYYDADGSGVGKQVEIATLSKKLKMTYKDFFVI